MNLVLDAIVGSAARTTSATRGWILGPHPEGLVVLAATGADDLVGTTVGADVGTAGYVFASGQPVAMVPRHGDPASHEGLVGRFDDPPRSVLCVPCSYGDEVLAVVELIDKVGGGGFTFDDIEIATVLADIVGAVVRSDTPDREVRSPAELSAELRQLAANDAEAYARVANVLDALLAGD